MNPADSKQGDYRPLTPSDTRATHFDAPEHVTQVGTEYRAVIETSAGTLIVEMFPDSAPETVNNFVFLALNRYYDGVPFHRVLDDFMAQTGDPTGTGSGGPGYEFDDEIDPERTHDAAGILSMANAGRGTNGSQFFLTFKATPWLDGKHTIFGRVIEGEKTLDALTRIDPGRPRGGVEPDRIETVVVLARD